MGTFNDRIEIVTCLRTGAYFDAFQAIDGSLDRMVFLKVARVPADALTGEIIEAHVSNWRRFARTHTDGMPAILEIGRNDGRWFLVTEWIRGASLSTFIDNQVIDDQIDFLFLLLRRCLSILEDLHSKGLIHADISPDNILVGGSSPHLTVNLVDPAPTAALPDPKDRTHKIIFGTPSFSAPEILAGHLPSPLTDLFALGTVIADTARQLQITPPELTQKLISPEPQDRPSCATAAMSMLGMSFDHAMKTGDHVDQWLRPKKDITVAQQVPRRFAVSCAYSVPVRVDIPQEIPATSADFSVVAPSLIQPGRNFVVEVWIAPCGERNAMLELATRSGRMIERGSRSHIHLDRDTIITVILKLPDFEVPDPIEMLGWNFDIRNVGFIVKAPASLKPGVYPGAAKLMQGGIPFASIMFDLEVASVEGCVETSPRVRDGHFRRIERAFASYASLDRAEVLRRVQGIQAAGTRVFLDIVDLRSGADWKKTLYDQIDTSDGFFLFWSRNAEQSPWVEREWRYALDRRGMDFISPLPLEDPRVAKPPAELRSKHFNDMLLAFIKVEDAIREQRVHHVIPW